MSPESFLFHKIIDNAPGINVVGTVVDGFKKGAHVEATWAPFSTPTPTYGEL